MRRCLLALLALGTVISLAACQKSPPPAPYAGGTVAKLTVIDKQVGTGTVAEPGMEMVVQYTGWLYDRNAADKHGRKFDSSLDHGGAPFEFVLGTRHVIKGWNLGLKGMRVGGVREILLPPDLAYGSKGAGDGVIPPNASLVFRVKLLDARTP